MNLKHAPEREILSFQPHQYKITTWCILAMLAVRLYFEIQHFIAKEFEHIEYFQLIQFSCALLISICVRLSLTTHRLTLKFGPFFRYEVQRAQIEKIYITPNQVHLLKTKYPTLTKGLFSRKKDTDNALDWKTHGALQFVSLPETTQKNQFSKAFMKQLALQQLSTEQTDDLIRHLNQNWGFETPLNTHIDEARHPATHQDIGQTPLYLLYGALALACAFAFIPLEAFHFGVESYLGLIPAGLIALAVSYAIIRTEKKSHPFASTFVCSLLLGASLYAVGLQSNRWYSESNPTQAQTHLLKLTEIDHRYQTWQLTPELQEKTGLNEIYINEKWAGFNRNLKLGQAYPVTIHEGYFKDYWIQEIADQ